MSVERGIEQYVLIVTDAHHYEKAERTCRVLRGEGYKSVLLKSGDSLNVSRLEEDFSKQSLGSVLLLFGEEKWSLTIERLAVSVGFLREDIYIDSIKKVRVFCSQCHDICTVKKKEMYVCRSCHQELEPSDHYSVFHRSYLAYPVFTTDSFD